MKKRTIVFIIILVFAPVISFNYDLAKNIWQIGVLESKNDLTYAGKLKLILIYYHLNNFQKVISIGEKLLPDMLHKTPDEKFVLAGSLGRAYQKNRQFDKEMEVYEKLLNDSPQYLHLSKAGFYEFVKNPELQIHELEECLKWADTKLKPKVEAELERVKKEKLKPQSWQTEKP